MQKSFVALQALRVRLTDGISTSVEFTPPSDTARPEISGSYAWLKSLPEQTPSFPKSVVTLARHKPSNRMSESNFQWLHCLTDRGLWAPGDWCLAPCLSLHLIQDYSSDKKTSCWKSSLTNGDHSYSPSRKHWRCRWPHSWVKCCSSSTRPFWSKDRIVALLLRGAFFNWVRRAAFLPACLGVRILVLTM